MKIIVLLILFVNCLSSAFSQKTDSIKHQNGYLYFHEYGTGDPYIVLTGGPGVGYLQLENVAIAISKNNRAILLEQRGTGRSMPTPFDATTININTAHADLNLLLDHLKLKQAHFIGHSWGAMLAMSFAANFPNRVQSLILLNPGPYKLDDEIFETYYHNQETKLSGKEKSERQPYLEKVRSGTANAEEQKIYEKWELIPMFYEREKVDSLVKIINRGGMNPAMGGLIFQSLGKTKFDLTKKLSLFKKPVHIITGAQDPASFVSYRIKILMPHTQLHFINKAGHFPMYEEPKAFNDALMKVIKSFSAKK